MKIHLKIKIGILEIGTFSAITLKYIEFEAEIFGLQQEKYELDTQKSTSIGWALEDENAMGTSCFNQYAQEHNRSFRVSKK